MIDREELQRLQDRVAWLRETVEEGEALVAKESMLTPFVRRYELSMLVLAVFVIAAFLGARAIGVAVGSRVPCPSIRYELSSASVTVQRHGPTSRTLRLDGNGTLTSTTGACAPAKVPVDPATVRDVIDRLARSCFFDMPDVVADEGSFARTITVDLGARKHSVTHFTLHGEGDSCVNELSRVEEQIESLAP